MHGLREVESTQEFVRITNEITLVIDYQDGLEPAGILRFANNDCEIDFAFSEDARQVFADIDNADPIELLTILAQKADSGGR